MLGSFILNRLSIGRKGKKKGRKANGEGGEGKERRERKGGLAQIFFCALVLNFCKQATTTKYPLDFFRCAYRRPWVMSVRPKARYFLDPGP